MEPQPILDTCPTPTNPPTPPLNSTPLALSPDVAAPSQPSLFNFLKNEIKDDDTYLDSFPPGYKFRPDDDELIVYYLVPKIQNSPLPRNKIIDVIFYEHNPKELAEKYKHYGNGRKEKKWYFFTPRDRKYKNGKRPNRAAGNGYWKATGADKKVRHKGRLVGYRKSLVFYVGKPPRGKKTNWIMHEFRVADPPKPRITGSHDMKLDDWVLCSIHKKDERPGAKNRQREDSVCNMDEDAENDNDNNNNLMVPPYDDHPSLPDPYSHRLFSYPFPSTTYNPFFNFGNNQLVEDVNNQLDSTNLNFGNFGSYGNLMMPHSPLRPFWKFNPTHENPFQSNSAIHDEVIYGGRFDEIDPSTLMSIPVPGVPASPYNCFENPLVQPSRIVENFDNSRVQPVRIAENFDNSFVQPFIKTAESPVKPFKSEK